MLLASYLFYSAWNPPFVILLWVSTVIDWYAAQGLVKAKRESARHAWMLLSVVANLGMLLSLIAGLILVPLLWLWQRHIAQEAQRGAFT